MANLNSVFNVTVPDVVQEHVQTRPGLPAKLIAAAAAITRVFGKVPLALTAREERLVIVLDSRLEVDVAEDQLSAFRRGWWRQNIDYLEDRVGVTIHYLE